LAEICTIAAGVVAVIGFLSPIRPGPVSSTVAVGSQVIDAHANRNAYSAFSVNGDASIVLARDVKYDGTGGQEPYETFDGLEHDFCSNFEDGNLVGLEGFEVTDGQGYFRPKLTAAFPEGRMLSVPMPLNGNYRVKVAFIPRDDRANVALQYGSAYRLIVGDGDLQTIKLEKNSSYPDVPERWEVVRSTGSENDKRFLNGYEGLERNARVEVIMDGSGSGKARSVNVDVKVTASPEGQSDQEDWSFSYAFDLPESLEQDPARLSVGVLDPYEQGVAVRFREVCVDKTVGDL
jgi:hypothetical protein